MTWIASVGDCENHTLADGAVCAAVRDEHGMRIPRTAETLRLQAAAPELLALARIIGSAYPNDPGTSDLDDDQPVTITLGTVRKAWAALAKVDR